MNANINYDIPISAFQFSEFQLLPHAPLNDIAITQMRTLLAASSMKRLK